MSKQYLPSILRIKAIVEFFNQERFGDLLKRAIDSKSDDDFLTTFIVAKNYALEKANKIEYRV